jgi:hypothetical protein
MLDHEHTLWLSGLPAAQRHPTANDSVSKGGGAEATAAKAKKLPTSWCIAFPVLAKTGARFSAPIVSV